MSRFRTLRGGLAAVGFLAALAAIGVLTVAFNLVLSSSLDAAADKALRTQAAAAATTVDVRDGRVVVRESADDAAIDRRVWIYAGTRAIERPGADRRLQRAADALAGRARGFRDLAVPEARLYAAPITARGRRVATVVTSESLVAYDRTTDLALVGSLALAGVLLAAVLALNWAIVGRALAPVREMTRSAADWSEHDADRRFGSTPRPDELSELAHTFDALLDRIAASLRHEQRLSAELSHELRSPLARIVAEVELLERRERSPEERRAAYASVKRSAEQMSAILETLMAAAREDARLDQGRSDVRATLAGLAADWRALMTESQTAIEVDGVASGLTAGVDPEVLERIVAPLLDNARRHARSRVEIAARAGDGRILVTVADDGPGIPAAERERVFEAGTRLGEANGHGGAGLGLALTRRLARAVGGEVTVEARPAGEGAAFRVELPS